MYSNIIAPKATTDKRQTLHEDTYKSNLTPIDIKPPFIPARPQKHTKLIICLTLFIICFTIIYKKLIKTHLLNQLIIKFEEYLRALYQQSPFHVFLLIFSIINFVLIFCLGSHSVFCVLTALVVKNPYVAFLILIISSISGDIIGFFVSKRFLRERIIQKFKQNDFFNVLLEESKNEPFKTAFLTRLLFIPAGIKNYILGAIDNKAVSYFSSGLLMHCFFIFESILVAQELTEIEQLLSKTQNWSEKSLVEKTSFILVLSFVFFTVLFIFAIGVWARKKILKRQMQPTELNMKVG